MKPTFLSVAWTVNITWLRTKLGRCDGYILNFPIACLLFVVVDPKAKRQNAEKVCSPSKVRGSTQTVIKLFDAFTFTLWRVGGGEMDGWLEAGHECALNQWEMRSLLNKLFLSSKPLLEIFPSDVQSGAEDNCDDVEWDWKVREKLSVKLLSLSLVQPLIRGLHEDSFTDTSGRELKVTDTKKHEEFIKNASHENFISILF